MNTHCDVRERIPMKLFPRSPISTLDPSTMVMLPIPPRTRFLRASEPVGPQLSKQMLAFSRAAWPTSPQILRWRSYLVFQRRFDRSEVDEKGKSLRGYLSWRSYLVFLGSDIVGSCSSLSMKVLSVVRVSATERERDAKRCRKKKKVEALWESLPSCLFSFLNLVR